MMRLTPYDRKKFDKRIYKLCKNQKILNEFVESGLDCAKLEDYPHKDAHSCYSCLRVSAMNMRLGNVISIHVEGNDVYLLRVTDDDQ